MSRLAKVAVVLAGYALAIAAGVVAAKIYDARVSALPYDTSGGMYAGGEMMSSLAAFLVVALVPTLLALWFLRNNHGFWNAVAILSLAFALVGLLAVLMPLVFRSADGHVSIMLLQLVGLSQLLGMPLWILSFALFAFLAPTLRARRKLLVAVGIEAVIGVCAAVHWLLPAPPL
jgi:hypothetical protein